LCKKRIDMCKRRHERASTFTKTAENMLDSSNQPVSHRDQNSLQKTVVKEREFAHM